MRTRRGLGPFLVVAILAGGLGGLASFGPAGAEDGPVCSQVGSAVTCSFAYNGVGGSDGSSRQFVVPAGVTSIVIDAWGAQGGDEGATVGGLCGHGRATFAVEPGFVLEVRAGGKPTQPGSSGYNGGGAGGGPGPNGGHVHAGGGGASDIRTQGDALSDRLVVGGAGGGSTGSATGGIGGGTTGGGDNTAGSRNGGGGTASAGGRAGVCDGFFPDLCVNASPGAIGQGGAGGFGAEGNQGGAGGGGGSGYVRPGATNVLEESGVRTGDGLVQISYTAPSAVYTSTYTPAQTRWLYIAATNLHVGISAAQHQGALFMVYLAQVTVEQNLTPAVLGIDAPTTPITVSSGYTSAEDTAVQNAAALFSTNPQTLQRRGVALLALLFSIH